MVEISTKPVQNENPHSLKIIETRSSPDTQTIIRNNERWINCSKQELNRLVLTTNNEIKYSRITSMVSLISSGAFLSISYLAYVNAHPVLSGVCSIGSGLSFITSLCCCSGSLTLRYCDESQNHSLDPSRTQTVLKAINIILNGETPECYEGYVKRIQLVQIKHFGILSEDIYNEYITLINEKQKINSEHNLRVKNCATTLTERSELWIDLEGEESQKQNLTTVFTAYEQNINEWNKRWKEFKPKLEADLPNPNLLQTTNRNNQTLPV